ncbi:MAG: hypothetical protein EOP48_00575, partial [Sphingobacteriales bacterium]
MIKLNRPPAPVEITDSRLMKKATSELYRYMNQVGNERFKANPMAFSEFRPFLAEMSNHKCAYCESALGSSSPVQIDHFRPKSGVKGEGVFLERHYFWLSYEWNNLIPCCAICTRSKMNFFPLMDESKRSPVMGGAEHLANENPLIINPCEVDP